MSWSGVENLLEGLVAQRTFLESRVPAYASLLAIVESELDQLAPRLEPGWQERRFDAWYERPLLLLAALRYDALLEGPRHPLHAAIAAEPPSAKAVTRDAVMAALAPERRRLYDTVARRAVQTNETSRAVAWMWVAALAEQADPGRGCALVDLGTSAGLNLVADGLASEWVDGQERPIPTGPLPKMTRRLGLDLRPLDALDPDTQMWLRACAWPGETARLARLDDAIRAFEAAQGTERAPTIEAMSIDEAPLRLGTIDAPRVIALQTIMRDYVPADALARYRDRMTAWLEQRPPAGALWVELELADDISDPERMAALTVHARPLTGSVQSLELARTHPHPRRLFVDGASVESLRTLLAASAH